MPFYEIKCVMKVTLDVFSARALIFDARDAISVSPAPALEPRRNVHLT